MYFCTTLRRERCLSSVVEHFLGKEEVVSSSLIDSSDSKETVGRDGLFFRNVQHHHDRSRTHPPGRRRRPAAPGHRRAVQRRNRSPDARHGARAGRRRHPHLPRRTLETPHQAGRIRRRGRRRHRLAATRQARNGHVRNHRSRYTQPCRGRPCGRYRPAMDRRPHDSQSVRHAGDRRRTGGPRHPSAAEKSDQPRPRTLDRRRGTAPQRRASPPGRHPPRLHLDRPQPLPQSPDVGHPHRTAPPLPRVADLLRSEPHRRPP